MLALETGGLHVGPSDAALHTRCQLACAVLTLNTAHANDTAVFRDVLKPGGKERSLAQKYADGYACGATGANRTVPFMPTFEKCMSRKGWVLDHYTSTR